MHEAVEHLHSLSDDDEVQRLARLRRESRVFFDAAVAEGEVRGEARGEARGRSATLAALLQRRFGPLPAWAADRIHAADASTLEAWTLNVLDAPSLEHVFVARDH